MQKKLITTTLVAVLANAPVISVKMWQ